MRTVTPRQDGLRTAGAKPTGVPKQQGQAGAGRPTKAEVAMKVAKYHAEWDGGILEIFRIKSRRKPIILLIVNEDTPATGIMPLIFRSNGDTPFDLVMIEVTPGEFRGIKQGTLSLPTGCELGESLVRRAKAVRD